MSAAIVFFVGGEEYTTRAWRFVPRIGEGVVLGPSSDETLYRVVDVIYGRDLRGATSQRVDITLEKA